MTKQEMIDIMNGNKSFNNHNGIVIVDFDDEYSVIEGKLTPNALNPLGIAHGGFVYSLCDVAAGVLCRTDPEHQTCVTLSGNLNFLRPSRGTKLRAEGRMLKRGRTVCIVETSVYDDSETLTAHGTFEIYLL